MSSFTFKTRGVCSSQIEIETENGIVLNVAFKGGCAGNLIGIGALVKGGTIEDVIEKLEGITCGGKATSCPDQLAKALKLNK